MSKTHLHVAFDVDNTLIKEDQQGNAWPNYRVIDLLRWFIDQDHEVFIWSGGGCEYARRWADELGFQDIQVIEKSQQSAKIWGVNLTVDDMPVEFGQGKILNIQV
jgi:phosphoserine phosphatase